MRFKFIRTGHSGPTPRLKYWSTEGKRQAVRLVMMNGRECNGKESGVYLRKE